MSKFHGTLRLILSTQNLGARCRPKVCDKMNWLPCLDFSVVQCYNSTTVNLQGNHGSTWCGASLRKMRWEKVQLWMKLCNTNSQGVVLSKRCQCFTLTGKPVPGDRLGRWDLSQHAESNPGPRAGWTRGPGLLKSPGGSSVHAPDAPSAAGESARRCQVGPDLSLAHMSVTYGAPVGVDRYICGGRQKELSAFILVMGSHSCSWNLFFSSSFQ